MNYDRRTFYQILRVVIVFVLCGMLSPDAGTPLWKDILLFAAIAAVLALGEFLLVHLFHVRTYWYDTFFPQEEEEDGSDEEETPPENL